MNRLGLLARVLLALVLVGLVPLVAASLQLVRLDVRGMRDQVLRTNIVAATTAAARVSAYLDSLERLAIAAVKNPVWAEEGASANAQRLVQDVLLESDPRVVGVVVTNQAGAEVFRAQRKTQAAAVRDVMAGLAGGSAGAAPPGPAGLAGDLAIVTDAAGRPWLRRSYAIPAVSGRLTVVADGAELRDVLRTDEIGEYAVLAIARGKDEIVLGSSPSATLAAFPKEMVAQAASGNLSGGQVFRDARGEEVLGAYSNVGRTGWSVLSRQPARVAETVARSMKRRAALTLAGALALTALIGAAAFQTLVRPLRDLVRVQQRLTAGAGSSKGNEIQQLTSGLQALERQADDQEKLGETFLGRYQVLKVIGSGGMGTVFRGWDPKLKRPVALKTVRAAGSQGTQPSERLVTELLEEAVTIARFSHPNIVAVYDVADSPEAAFIAMELVEGLSLHEYLKRASSLGPGEAVTMGAAVAAALAAAHARRIVHHDIKPGNILLGTDGSIKVTDFGIAQILSARAEARKSVFGTPGYIPPETIRGEGYDESGDLFALGVVLYRSVCGLLPFSGRGPKAIMEATLDVEPAAPARRRPDLPAELDALIMALLSKEKVRRPAPASSVAESLEALAGKHGWRWSPSLWAGAKESSHEDDQPRSGLFPTMVLSSATGRSSFPTR